MKVKKKKSSLLFCNFFRFLQFFIMVTDEIENEPSNGSFFAQLFYKYYVEVHPARLVMVSFLDDPNVKVRNVFFFLFCVV